MICVQSYRYEEEIFVVALREVQRGGERAASLTGFKWRSVMPSQRLALLSLTEGAPAQRCDLFVSFQHQSGFTIVTLCAQLAPISGPKSLHEETSQLLAHFELFHFGYANRRIHICHSLVKTSDTLFFPHFPSTFKW